MQKMKTKHLTLKGEMWPPYAAAAAYAMNSFAYEGLSEFSQFESVFVRNPMDLLNLTYSPLEQLANIHKDCLQLLKGKAELVAGILLDYKTQKVQDTFLNASM